MVHQARLKNPLSRKSLKSYELESYMLNLREEMDIQPKPDILIEDRQLSEQINVEEDFISNWEKEYGED